MNSVAEIVTVRVADDQKHGEAWSNLHYTKKSTADIIIADVSSSP